ncbi:ClpX C4-type zinc finger protein [Myxococcaceae bacterium GXIMD 01537]
MAENPRDYIRAAQAAELSGDRSGAADLLHRAAAVYARSGSLSRALQLLRRARGLDGTRDDIAQAMRRLERQAGSGEAGAPDGGLAGEVLTVPSSPEELAEQERLIAEALQAAERELDAAARESVRTWTVEDLSSDVPADALDWAVRAVADLPSAGGEPPLDVEEEAPSGRGARFFERGPTRADAAQAAWCSFCCRPSAEVGGLVAGPAGAFICSACVGESGSLLTGETPVPRPVPSAPLEPEAALEDVELVGREEAPALLASALEAGVRRVLVLGPEGVGKSAWFQALQQWGGGVLVTVDALEESPPDAVLLVEDVERLGPEAQASLAAFLAREPSRTVLMSARGTLGHPGWTLRDGSVRLPLHSTAALAKAVGGALPMALLEQVQLAVPLRAPTRAELTELARRWLALRAPAVTVAPGVLAALVAEAARSPRVGHELRALLARIPAGAWGLATPPKKPARGRRRKVRT